MARVTFERVSKRHGELTVVHPFDLEVADHELVVLVGGSGSGKSTTLRLVAGLETLTAGRIRIGERDVTDLPPRQRDVAMVFQDYALYPHLTVEENLSLGLRLRQVPPGEIRRRVAWAAELLELAPLLGRRPGQLSGGQRQRVATGRAIVREPAVFLFDEPLSNLDALLRGQMRVEIAALQRRLGTTTLYVTHDQVEAMTLADRIVVIDRGHLQQVGRPMDLYNEPSNRFVAGFLGSPPMSFVEGELAAHDGGLWFVAGGIRLPIPPERQPAAAASGAAVTLGVRPEHLTLAADAPGRPAVTGELLLAERLGGQTLLHVAVGSHRLVALIHSDHEPAPGQPVALAVTPRFHLFAASGVRLDPAS